MKCPDGSTTSKWEVYGIEILFTCSADEEISAKM
jgi:hypothetical protein